MEFKVGQIVACKIDGGVWWPSFIKSIRPLYCKFFDEEVGMNLPKSKVRKFLDAVQMGLMERSREKVSRISRISRFPEYLEKFDTDVAKAQEMCVMYKHSEVTFLPKVGSVHLEVSSQSENAKAKSADTHIQPRESDQSEDEIVLFGDAVVQSEITDDYNMESDVDEKSRIVDIESEVSNELVNIINQQGDETIQSGDFNQLVDASEKSGCVAVQSEITDDNMDAREKSRIVDIQSEVSNELVNIINQQDETIQSGDFNQLVDASEKSGCVAVQSEITDGNMDAREKSRIVDIQSEVSNELVNIINQQGDETIQLGDIDKPVGANEKIGGVAVQSDEGIQSEIITDISMDVSEKSRIVDIESEVSNELVNIINQQGDETIQSGDFNQLVDASEKSGCVAVQSEITDDNMDAREKSRIVDIESEVSNELVNIINQQGDETIQSGDFNQLVDASEKSGCVAVQSEITDDNMDAREKSRIVDIQSEVSNELVNIINQQDETIQSGDFNQLVDASEKSGCVAVQSEITDGNMDAREKSRIVDIESEVSNELVNIINQQGDETIQSGDFNQLVDASEKSGCVAVQSEITDDNMDAREKSRIVDIQSEVSNELVNIINQQGDETIQSGDFNQLVDASEKSGCVAVQSEITDDNMDVNDKSRVVAIAFIVSNELVDVNSGGVAVQSEISDISMDASEKSRIVNFESVDVKLGSVAVQSDAGIQSEISDESGDVEGTTQSLDEANHLLDANTHSVVSNQTADMISQLGCHSFCSDVQLEDTTKESKGLNDISMQSEGDFKLSIHNTTFTDVPAFSGYRTRQLRQNVIRNKAERKDSEDKNTYSECEYVTDEFSDYYSSDEFIPSQSDSDETTATEDDLDSCESSNKVFVASSKSMKNGNTVQQKRKKKRIVNTTSKRGKVESDHSDDVNKICSKDATSQLRDGMEEQNEKDKFQITQKQKRKSTFTTNSKIAKVQTISIANGALAGDCVQNSNDSDSDFSDIFPSIKTSLLGDDVNLSNIESDLHTDDLEELALERLTIKSSGSKTGTTSMFDAEASLLGSTSSDLVSVVDKQASSGKLGDGTELKVVVPKAVKTSEGKRIYDKRHACYYCGDTFSKISDHLENKHSSEIEVAEVLAKPKKSKARKAGWAKIRKKGCFHHNIKALSEKKGTLIVDRRPNKDHESDNFLPCPHCLAFFVSHDLWRHTQNCPFVEKGKETVSAHIQKTSKLLLQGCSEEYSDTVDSEFSKLILCCMKKGEVLETLKSDRSLILFGANMLKKVGTSRSANVRQKLRELVRLLILLRDTSNTTAIFTDFITPQNFDVIVKCVQELCKAEEIEKQRETQRGCPLYDKPNLALKLGHSLKHMAQLKRGQALRMGDTVRRKEAEEYLLLHEAEWAEKISRHAAQTIAERKFNDPDILPLTEDVVNLKRFLLQEMEELIKSLSVTPDITKWRKLAQTVLCRVTVFNKRRGGETGQMLLSSYQNRKTDWQEAGNSEIISTLEPIEKSLMKRLQLVEIVGKRSRKVPVLLTADMTKAIDCLVKHRSNVGIPSTNKYLFAAPSSENGYLKGWDALHDIAKKADLVKPELLTTTNLRKYIATVSQVVDLGSNQELEWLANHMGHTLSVHHQYYRLQEHTLELAKVSKLLIAVDAGKCHEYAGKTLNDITLDQIPDAVCNEVDEEELEKGNSKLPCEGFCEVDDELSNVDVEGTKVQTKTKSELQKPRKLVAMKRTPWKEEDCAFLKKYFHLNIVKKTPPSKNDVIVKGRQSKAIQSILDNRGWKAIKYYVWNLAQQHHKKKNMLRCE